MSRRATRIGVHGRNQVPPPTIVAKNLEVLRKIFEMETTDGNQKDIIRSLQGLEKDLTSLRGYVKPVEDFYDNS